MHTESDSTEEFALSISLIHVAYDRIEKRLANFSQLVQAQPDIVTHLLQVIPPNESEMVSMVILYGQNYMLSDHYTQGEL